jgi:hypothetical protein
MLSGQASGRPPGWLGELRKEPKVLDRLSQIADNEVIASLKAGIRPGYEGADFEFIDQRLGPEGREGLTEPPELEGITFEPGVVDMSHPFKDKNKPSPIGRWWEDERDQGRMNALIAISKNVDKTKGLGKIHLERGLEDTRNFNRKIAAGALGKVVNGKTVGDPQSLPTQTLTLRLGLKRVGLLIRLKSPMLMNSRRRTSLLMNMHRRLAISMGLAGVLGLG